MSVCPVRGGRLVRADRAQPGAARRPRGRGPRPTHRGGGAQSSRTPVSVLVGGDERGGMGLGCLACFKSMVQLRLVDGDHLSGALAGRRGRSTTVEPTFTSYSWRREPIAVDLRLLLGPDDADRTRDRPAARWPRSVQHRSGRSSGGRRATTRSCSPADARTGAGPGATEPAGRGPSLGIGHVAEQRSARRRRRPAVRSAWGSAPDRQRTGARYRLAGRACELVAKRFEPIPQPAGARPRRRGCSPRSARGDRRPGGRLRSSSSHSSKATMLDVASRRSMSPRRTRTAARAS